MHASSMVWGTLVLAVIAVAVLWRLFAPVVALAALGVAWAGQLLTGARFARGGVWVHAKEYDGFFFPKDQGWWLSRFAVALVALPTPSIIGVLLARGVTLGWNARTVLLVLLVLIASLALGHGNWATLLLIGAICAGLLVLILLASHRDQVGALVAISWFFLLGGLRLTLEEAGRKHAQTTASFPGLLQRLTDIPGAVWMLGFVVIALAATVTGSRWLLAMS